MIVLASGLPGLEFQPGLPVPGAAQTPPPAGPAAEPTPPANPTLLPWLLQAALAVGFFALLLVFVITLLKKASIKRIGLLAAGTVVLLALFALLPQLVQAPPAAPAGDGGIQSPETLAYDIAPIGDPPESLVWLVVAGLLLTVAAIGVWLLVKAFQRSKTEDPLAREADAALQAIGGGQNLNHVIIHCYLQMERVMKDEQGLGREAALTPREFEQYLAVRGIPAVPIRQLTRLFEKARYGSQAAGPQDEHLAVDSLSAIRAASLAGKRAAR